MNPLPSLRRKFMGVSDAEATAFARDDGSNWTHLQTAVRHAVDGYHAVLDDSRRGHLIPRLDAVDNPWRGYAYEGAAMGLTGMDCFLPGPARFQTYVTGPGREHAYMAHIGAGEALARLHRQPERFLRRLPHPVLRWLVMDGYGFHEGFFKPDRHIISQQIPTHLGRHARHIFDQGLGRSIWFITGADIDDVAVAVGAFPAARHQDLWLGIGVACGYVGGVESDAIRHLQQLAGDHADQLAVGTAFVAKGRIRAGNLIPDTDLAARILCGLPATNAAHLVDQAFIDIEGTSAPCAYDELQQRLAVLLTAPDPTAPLDEGHQP